MASVTLLWLSIDVAFSEFEALCVEARAAQLAVQAQAEEAALLDNLAHGRTHRVVSAPPARGERDPRSARAAELSRDLAFRESHPQGPNLVELRGRVRKRLQWLKGELAEALSEHEVHYVLLPLVIYIDELMATITRGAALRWEPLQSELYDITNGGEHFYVLLDEHLRKSETDPIVFQMFYFCLSDGFVGMAESDPRKIEQYKALLLARIPLELPAEMPAARKPEQPIELVSFPWQPYAWSAAAIALGWMLFRVLAEFS